ncbi:hypothetical protein SAMN05421770_10661 [Granulicella rosea]|uniref:Uncharacterized protein n=1 Tax=Granulicella rosea TaxID=474952 RepID=A0A239L259_9BACT|nr:hypothetical protein [Granulicella rosea]SNT24646.1 hypothetical protein SAMN05421770_10661 [Granulicella rosea]
MKAGTDNKKQTMMAAGFGVLALGAVFYMYTQLFGGPSTPSPVVAPVAVHTPPPVITTTSVTNTKGVTVPSGFAVGGEATKIATTGGQLDPTLHEEAMRLTESVVYSGSGRNIFGAGQTYTQVDIPKPKVGPRPQTIATVVEPPKPYVYVPPPIDLKFFGTATAANGDRRAFLLHGEDVFLASTGDIVQRRYKVVSIAANSIVIDDMPNNNKQTLPLQAN